MGNRFNVASEGYWLALKYYIDGSFSDRDIQQPPQVRADKSRNLSGCIRGRPTSFVSSTARQVRKL